MNELRAIKRTDYSGYVRPRRPAGTEATETVAPPADPEQMTVSVRIQLPDYTAWRAYIFARQYPFLSLAIAFGGLLGLFILGELAAWLVHVIFAGSK